MIELENICFSYEKNSILSNVNVQFEANTLYAIIGPNGCGKTTLLDIISKIKSPQSGKIIIDEKNPESFSKKNFAKCISYLPQSVSPADMSVYDYVCNGRYPYLGLSKKLSKQDRLQVEYALNTTDTASFATRNIRELSGGERQRVYIALMLAQNTPYMLLDEPTTYLDISSQFAIMNMLKDIKNCGKCIITVVHELSLALKFCDKVLILNNGQVQCLESPQTIVESGYIDQTFGINCTQFDIDGKTEYVLTEKKL